jgi:hypothetical protein
MQEHTVEMEKAAALGGDIRNKRLNGRLAYIGIWNSRHGRRSS